MSTKPTSDNKTIFETGRKFNRTYAKFVELHKNNAYNDIVQLIPDIPIDHLPTDYALHFDAMIANCFNALGRTKDPYPSNISQHLCAAYAHLLSLKPEPAFVFATVGHLDRVFAIYTPAEADRLALCDTIVKRFEQIVPQTPAANGAAIEALHVPLFHCLLVLMRLEKFADGATSVTKSVYTVRVIAMLKRCAASGSAFRNSLNTLLLTVLVCQNEIGIKNLLEWVQKQRLPSSGGEDLCTNTLLTVCQLLDVLKVSKLGEAGATARLILFMDSAREHIDKALKQSLVFGRSACNLCRSNAMQHQLISLGKMAVALVKECMSRNVDDLDANTSSALARLCCQSAAIVRTLKCPNVKYLRHHAEFHVVSLVDEFVRHKQLRSGRQYLRHVFATAESIELNGGATPLYSIERMCFDLTRTAIGEEETIVAQYINISHLLKHADYPCHTIERQISAALKIIWDLESMRPAVFDIDGYLHSVQYSVNGLPVPRLPIAELPLHLLHYGYVRANATPLRDSLAEHILSVVPDDQPLQALRVSSGFIGNQIVTPVYDRLRKAYARAKQQQLQFASSAELKRRWYVTVANMEAIEFVHVANAQQERASGAIPDKSVDFKDTAKMLVFRNCVNLAQETLLLRRVQSALRWYGKFVGKLGATEADRVLYSFEICCMMLALNLIGDQCAMRSHRSEAWRAFRLQLMLSHIGGPVAGGQVARLLSITYMAWNSADCEAAAREDVSTAGGSGEMSMDALSAEVQSCADEVLCPLIEQITTLSRRRQGTTVCCLLSIALFHAERHSATEAQEMLSMAERLICGLEQRFEMPVNNHFRIRYYAVLLKMITRLNMHCAMPPIVLAESMLRMCHTLSWHNSDNVQAFHNLLLDVLWDVTLYCVARYDFGEVYYVLQMLLKLCVRRGLALTSGRLLALWVLVELYKENAEGADLALGLLDDCMGIYDGRTGVDRTCGLVQGMSKLMVNDAEPMIAGATAAMVRSSPVLRREERRVSPICETKNRVDIPYQKYLLTHPATCDCAICKHPTFQHLVFEVAVLYCRTFYIKAHFQTSLAAFEHTHRHYRKMLDAAALSHKPSSADTFVDVQAQAICRLYVYYAHTLVRCGQPGQAAEMIGLALDWWSRAAYPDEAIEQDLLVQQIALEQMQQKPRTPTVKRPIDRWPQVDVAKVLQSRATAKNAQPTDVVETKSKTKIPKSTTTQSTRVATTAKPVKPLTASNRIKPIATAAKIISQRIADDTDADMSIIERSPQQSPVSWPAKSKKASARQPSKCQASDCKSQSESSPTAETTETTDPPPKRVTRATRANARKAS